MQRDETASQQRIVVEFTEPVRVGEFDMGLKPVALVVCKRCGAAIPLTTLLAPVEEALQPLPPDPSLHAHLRSPLRVERPVNAVTLHADWHRIHNHGGEYQ